MVLKRIGTPKKIFSATEPIYEQRAVWIETDGNGNILSQYVGLFDQWVEIPVTGKYPIHFDYLQSTEPAPKAGASWLGATSFMSNTVDTPTVGDNIYEFNIATLSDVFNVNSITVDGVEKNSTNTFQSNGAADGDLINYTVGGNITPQDETISLTGKGGSTTRGPVTITDSGSATVDPQETKVENATVTFTGDKTTQPKSYTGTTDGTKIISIDGNKTPTGPSNGSPKVTISTIDKSYSSGTVSGGSLTIPSTAPAGTYSVGKLKVTLSGFVSDGKKMWLNKNGVEIFSTTDDGWYNNAQTSFSVNVPDIELSPGDTLTFEQTITDVQKNGTEGVTTISTSSGVTKTISTNTSGVSTDLALNKDDISISLSQTGASISSYSIEYNDVYQTQDPSLTVDGETVSHAGMMLNGETVTKTLTGLTPGSHTATTSVIGPALTSIEWTDVTETKDPSVTIGSSTVSHTGILNPGQTVTEPVNLSTGVDTATVSSTGPVDISGTWTEVTHTNDPTVDINGNRVSYTGFLSGTESVNLDVQRSWLLSGANTIELVSGGPANLIFTYDTVDGSSSNLTVRLYYSDGISWKEIN